MALLMFFIAAVTVLQVGILAFCYVHRRDPLAVLPRDERAQVLIDLLKVHNALRAADLVSDTLLQKGYGSLNIAQMELLHQISIAAKDALQTLDAVVDPGSPLTPHSPSHADQQAIDNARLFQAPSHSILSHLYESKSDPKHPHAA